MKWPEINRKARECRKSNNPAERIKCLTKLFEQSNKDSWVAYQLGQEYELTKNREKALLFYRIAEQQLPFPEYKFLALQAIKRLEDDTVKKGHLSDPARDYYCYIITHECPKPRTKYLNEKGYQDLVDNTSGYDLFIDGFTKIVWKKKRKTKLTDGELSMLREYIEKRQVLAPFQTGEYESAYRRLEVEEAQAKQGLQELSQTGSLESEKGIKLDEAMRRVQNLLKGREKSALEMFKKARAKIDIKQRGKYCCFQRIQSRGRGRYAKYQFNPPDDLTYCLIIPVV